MQRKKLHILEVFMVFFMQQLYFEEFISFAALFFYIRVSETPASAFHDFNKEQIGKKTNFCKIKCYVNTFNKKSDRLPLFYNNLLNKISMGISFFKKKRQHWLEDFAWRVERVTQKFRLSSVSFLSVYLFSVTKACVAVRPAE